MIKKLKYWIFVFLLCSSYVFGSCNSNYLMDYQDLPLKNQFITPAQVQDANERTYSNGEWVYSYQSTKCPSYATSTVVDWFNFQIGNIFNSYESYISGEMESGYNPRILEQIYESRISVLDSKYGYSQLLNIWISGDPVTQEPVLYPSTGFVDILKNSPTQSSINDSNILSPITTYSVYPNYLSLLQDYYKISGNSLFEHIKKSIDNNEIVLGVMYGSGLTSYAGIHHIAIMGYSNCDGNITYYGYESDGTQYNRSISEDELKYAYFFIPKGDWPTFHHDNRRTGFTLLKGDANDEDDIREYNIVLHKDVTEDVISRASLADLDDDGNMDILVSASKTSSDGWLYRLESTSDWTYKGYTIRKARIKERWTKEMGISIRVPPVIADTYGNDDKEIFVGLHNGTLLAYKSDGDVKWAYPVPGKNRSSNGDFVIGELGYIAIADIDLDGKKEIIFTDSQDYWDWDGELYVLEDNGNSYIEEDTISIGNGGAWGAPSIADIDGDDKIEIVVPTNYGVKVYEFSSGSLSLEWSNSHGRIEGAVVISDIDRVGDVL